MPKVDLYWITTWSPRGPLKRPSPFPLVVTYKVFHLRKGCESEVSYLNCSPDKVLRQLQIQDKGFTLVGSPDPRGMVFKKDGEQYRVFPVLDYKLCGLPDEVLLARQKALRSS